MSRRQKDDDEDDERKERGRERRGKRGSKIDRETAGDCARERERER